MADTPNFQDPQFVDANGTGGLNAAYTTSSKAIANATSGAFAAPGLLAPEVMAVSFAGTVATVALPFPWGVVASGGTIVRAHGTVSNSDTQTYTVPFSGAIPGSGSVTAYLVATPTSIQQNPIPIPGPPQGHPSWSPNFTPYVGYATEQDTVSLAATTTAPNNISAFELLRTTLTAAQSTIAVWSTAVQMRATPTRALPYAAIVAGGTLTPQQAQGALACAVTGTTSSLPLAELCAGLTFTFFNVAAVSGAWTIATSDSLNIYGLNGSSGVASVDVNIANFMALYCDGVNWRISANSPNFMSHGTQAYSGAGTYSFTVPSNVYVLKGIVTGAGGGGSDCITSSGTSGDQSGGGGGAGGTAIKRFAVTPGQVLSIVVGAGGAAQSSGGVSAIVGVCSGGGGLASTFAGTASSAGGGPGNGSGGDINMYGGWGSDGQSSTQIGMGNGGASYWGGGGRAANQGQSGPTTGVAPGSGGGGAYDSTNSGANYMGGPGAAGIATLEW